MDPKDDPYRLKPPTKLVREEQKLIQIRDDSVRPPSSVGVDAFQAIFFGAPALQPSKAPEQARRISFGVAWCSWSAWCRSCWPSGSTSSEQASPLERRACHGVPRGQRGGLTSLGRPHGLQPDPTSEPP